MFQKNLRLTGLYALP